MTLQASGAISIANIATEFGGAQPHSLSEYYRGGSYVGSNNTNVPTTGAISLSNFYGATAYALLATTPSGYLEQTGLAPGSALVQLRVSADGYIYPFYGYGDQLNFGTASGTNIAAGKYWKWNYYSGQVPTSGTVTENTWTAVGSGVVNMLRSTSGARTGVVTITLANDAAGNGATTGGQWTLSAIVEI